MGALLLLALASAPCPGHGVARDAAALREALAGSARDVWVSGVVEGDFEATRGVALHGCEGAVLRGSGHGTVLRLKGDDVLVEDVTLERSGSRVSFEDGALKVSGARAVVRRVTARDTLYGIAKKHDVEVDGLRAAVALGDRRVGLRRREARARLADRDGVDDDVAELGEPGRHAERELEHLVALGLIDVGEDRDVDRLDHLARRERHVGRCEREVAALGRGRAGGDVDRHRDRLVRRLRQQDLERERGRGLVVRGVGGGEVDARWHRRVDVQGLVQPEHVTAAGR